MIKLSTDIGQSRLLVGLGLDVNTADMTFKQVDLGDKTEYYLGVGLDVAVSQNLYSYRMGYVVPSWSLTALFNILQDVDGFQPQLGRFDKRYRCYYANQFGLVSLSCFADDPIDAAFNMVVGLLEGFNKTEEK